MPGRPFYQGNRRAAKLTGEQVLEIRERYATEHGCSQARLSREYGVTTNTIANIVNGLTWQHLLRDEEPMVNRPPVHAQPPPMPSEAELHAQIDQAIAKARALAPSLYDDPPPRDEEAEQAAARAQACFQSELAKLKPTLGQQVNDELDKLTKGD